MRISLLVASLVAAVFLGSLFARTQPLSTSSPLQLQVAVTTPIAVLPTSTREAAITICEPDDQASSCLPGELDSGQDLADAGNGAARPAVSNDAYLAHQARYVNDGREGVSWVSKSADSWIKIDLGQVTTINMISLEKGDLVSSRYDDLGPFVIAVALSDVYADGDSSNDDREYAPVFHSEQSGFSEAVSHTEIISTRFSPVEARFIKITFEREGAAIEEVGAFMVEPPVLAEQPTRIPQDELPDIPVIPTHTNTSVAIHTSTSVPTNTMASTPTATTAPSQTPTNTPPPSDTPTVLPTHTQPPADTATPVPTDPFPTEVPPTAIEPTAILSTVQPSFASSEPIMVTASDQTLIFTCNGNAAEIRGHANTVTLLGSCSRITVSGNGNRVFWQFGSPVITTTGGNNIVSQL